MTKAVEVMHAGGDTLDAVIAGVNIVHRRQFAAAPDGGKGRLFDSAYFFERKA